MSNFEILMVGPTGAGKTSLLTSMYDVLKSDLSKMGCSLTPDGSTRGPLHEQREKLETYGNTSHKDIGVQADEGIEGTSDERAYEFAVRLDQDRADHDFTIRFTDIPGRWINHDPNGRVAELMQRANATMIAIDATALMEEPKSSGTGKYHSKINSPKPILEAYEHAGIGMDNVPHTVIYALVKAETYYEDGRILELRNRAQEAYSDLTRYFLSQGVSVYLMPVKTVGCLRFHRFTDTETGLMQYFRRIVGREYEPQDCDVPLRLMLREALDAHLVAKRGGMPAFFTQLLEFFGANKRLKEVLEEISAEVDQTSYKIDRIS